MAIKGWVMVGAIAGTFAMASVAAAAPFVSLSVRGQGTINWDSSTCPTYWSCPGSDSCVCVELTGLAKGGKVGRADFDMVLGVDTSVPVGAGSDCYTAAGEVTFTGQGHGNHSVTMETNGLVCNSLSDMHTTYSGGADIASGTGKFSNAVGTANINWEASTLNITDPAELQLTGNIGR